MRQQAITWCSVEPHVWGHMASPGHNELMWWPQEAGAATAILKKKSLYIWGIINPLCTELFGRHTLIARFMGPTWGQQDPGGPHVGPMNRAIWVSTVGTPYNTNVGVQKLPDRAIWKPVVAKRNNTNPWSCSKSQILVTRDARIPRWLGVNFSRHAFITDCLTTL